jgi:hypothetical protein
LLIAAQHSASARRVRRGAIFGGVKRTADALPVDELRRVLRARAELLPALEAELQRQPRSHAENLRIFEALRREAVTLGRLPTEDALEDIEVDLAWARVIRG